MNSDQEKWDKRYRDAEGIIEAAPVLRDFRHLLPTTGRALDLACGLGGNALLLAEHGLETHAWDLSPVAIQQLQAVANARGLSNLTASINDVEHVSPNPNHYDVITVSFFLDRQLCPAIVTALKPDGLLFYQTFTRTRVSERGPKNPRFRLADNELLRLFSSLQIVVYREEGDVGNTNLGFRDQALLVGRKR